MSQHFHRPVKIKFAIELKRKRTASSRSSTSSDLTNPKRRAIPAEEDSPLAQLSNDVGIQALVREVEGDDEILQISKEFLISLLQGLMNNSPEEGANYIYDEARQIWDCKRILLSSCTYAIDKERSLLDKLMFYSNNDAPAQRMASMLKDPWLEYILGDTVSVLKQSDDAITRGFLCILIAYWNMRDILDKVKLGEYRRTPTSASITPTSKVIGRVAYVMDHPHDFQCLKTVLEAKYGTHPDLVASLFEQITNYQDFMNRSVSYSWTTGKRVMFDVSLRSDGSSQITVGKTFSYKFIP
ncbi:hypothetical protein CASFOL_028905 [Castilleja foliolosa]|uniref:Uncharacterized protein n=1 Tax=Castilleja foliolosa TaxID=1961234 RepID=A0ABD3CFT7_9LAMI